MYLSPLVVSAAVRSQFVESLCCLVDLTEYCFIFNGSSFCNAVPSIDSGFEIVLVRKRVIVAFFILCVPDMPWIDL